MQAPHDMAPLACLVGLIVGCAEPPRERQTTEPQTAVGRQDQHPPDNRSAGAPETRRVPERAFSEHAADQDESELLERLSSLPSRRERADDGLYFRPWGRVIADPTHRIATESPASEGAPAAAFALLGQHFPRGVPADYRAFLERFNGADLGNREARIEFGSIELVAEIEPTRFQPEMLNAPSQPGDPGPQIATDGGIISFLYGPSGVWVIAQDAPHTAGLVAPDFNAFLREILAGHDPTANLPDP